MAVKRDLVSNQTQDLPVTSVLLYGSETWRTTNTTTKTLQTISNRPSPARRILQIQWWQRVSNKTLWERNGQYAVKIARRRWSWIGYTTRNPPSRTIRQSLTWYSQGIRKRGLPRNSWRRDVEADVRGLQKTWRQMERTAQDRST